MMLCQSAICAARHAPGGDEAGPVAAVVTVVVPRGNEEPRPDSQVVSRWVQQLEEEVLTLCTVRLFAWAGCVLGRSDKQRCPVA